MYHQIATQMVSAGHCWAFPQRCETTSHHSEKASHVHHFSHPTLHDLAQRLLARPCTNTDGCIDALADDDALIAAGFPLVLVIDSCNEQLAQMLLEVQVRRIKYDQQPLVVIVPDASATTVAQLTELVLDENLSVQP